MKKLIGIILFVVAPIYSMHSTESVLEISVINSITLIMQDFKIARKTNILEPSEKSILITKAGFTMSFKETENDYKQLNIYFNKIVKSNNKPYNQLYCSKTYYIPTQALQKMRKFISSRLLLDK